MITIKQHKDNWRIKITDEEWEFVEDKDFEEILKTLIELKKKYGKLNDFDRNRY